MPTQPGFFGHMGIDRFIQAQEPEGIQAGEQGAQKEQSQATGDAGVAPRKGQGLAGTKRQCWPSKKSWASLGGRFSGFNCGRISYSE